MASRLGLLLVFALSMVAANLREQPIALAGELDTSSKAAAIEATRLYKQGSYARVSTTCGDPNQRCRICETT